MAQGESVHALPEQADPDCGIKILFYPTRYHSGLESIFAMGEDIMSIILDGDGNNNGDKDGDKNGNDNAYGDVCIQYLKNQNI